MADDLYKHCTKCGLDKPRSEFRIDKQKKDGLYSSCRQCCSEREKARYDADPDYRKHRATYRYRNPESVKRSELRQRTVNRERLLERKREYYARAAQIPEMRQRWKDYREANKERVYAKQKEWRLANAERRYAVFRKWTERNPDKLKWYRKTTHARRRAATKGGATAAELRAWVNAAKKECYWCGRRCATRYHVDHYVPLARGGAHELGNLVIACPPCNQSKSAKDPLRFANERGRLF